MRVEQESYDPEGVLVLTTERRLSADYQRQLIKKINTVLPEIKVLILDPRIDARFVPKHGN